MLPFLLEGDRVWLQRAEWECLRVGDLVVFEKDGIIYTHRVIKKSAQKLFTKGDNHFIPDLSIPSHKILGKVHAIERNGEAYQLEGERAGINLVLGYCHYCLGLFGQTLLGILRGTNGMPRWSLYLVGRGALLPLKILERILIWLLRF